MAAATEQLFTSIREIGRQVAQSAEIAALADQNASQTDARVHALAAGAQKIGEVVTLPRAAQ